MSPAQKIDLEDFKSDNLTNPLAERINEVRKEKSLPPLKFNKILSEAANDQAEANRKYNQISIEQSNKKKALPSDRVAYYGGFYQEVDEYDLGIEIQTKSTLKTSRKSKNPSTYGELVEFIVSEWLDERHASELLDGQNFYEVGFGFAPNKFENTLFVSIVLASEPYQKHKGFKYHPKSYKIAPYDRNVCKGFERDFKYISELFSDNLRVQGKNIMFYYHDLNLMEALLESNRDMLAIDVLEKSQFSCESGNMLHPSPVYDGMMLKPLKKSKLLKKNPLKEAKEFSAKLGEIPHGLDTSDIELSLIVIKDKCACKKIPYNFLDGKNIRMLDINLAVDTISIAASVDSNSRFLEFTIPFEKNKSDYMVEDIKPFLDSIQLNRFNIKEIEIMAYSSIEGNPILNEQLQQKRAASILSAIKEYQLQEVQTKIETKENWEGFYESIKGSPYEADYKNKSHDEVRMIVNSDTLKYDLEPYLEDQRKADIRIFVESIYIDSLEAEYLPSKFRKSIIDKDYIRAKALQTLLYRAVLEGELEPKVLFEGEIPQFKEYVPLSNNRLAFRLQFNEGEPSDSLIDKLRMDVEALLGVDEGNGHINFNKQAIKLYYWAKDINLLVIDEENRIDEVKDFERDIRKLYNTKIDNYQVNRLLLNYNIIAADYYYEKQDFRNRQRALKQVRRYVKKAKLSRNQTYEMARYFIYQMQIEWAVQIMLPFVKEDDFDEDFLMTFLSLVVYDNKYVKEDKVAEYFERGSKDFPEGFCNLFVKPGMSLEFFTDIRLKSLYCNTCSSDND